MRAAAASGSDSAAVLYNLGNAHVRMVRLGPAIWSYERALVRAPLDEDIAYNLKLARAEAAKLAQERIEGATSLPWWESLAAWANPSWLSIAFLSLWSCVFCGLLLLRRFAGVTRAALAATTATLGMAALVLGAWLALRVWYDTSVQRAIVLPDRLEAREGPDATHRSTFPLHAGLRVRVVDRDAGFHKVRLPNGLEGWVQSDQLGML